MMVGNQGMEQEQPRDSGDKQKQSPPNQEHLLREGYPAGQPEVQRVGAKDSSGDPGDRRATVRDSSWSEGDLRRIPPQVTSDLEKSENFVISHSERISKLLPNGEDPRSFPALETQEQVDARFAGIKWPEYEQARRAMQNRLDPQKQHLSDFDLAMVDLLQQQTLLKNYPTVNLLGNGLARNAGKYRDLLQTFNKDLQVIGMRCQLKDGNFSVEA
jgi:hypothetical protein